jgi:hypothetical protein
VKADAGQICGPCSATAPCVNGGVCTNGICQP